MMPLTTDKMGYKYVRVKSPDTDIFFILLHHAEKLDNIILLFDTGRGSTKKCINVLASMCPVLLLHYTLNEHVLS